MHDKRPDIQGLRAWAVIFVVIFHFFPSLLPYGYLGVDVFFVLSGFLITLVLEGRPSSLSTYYNFYFKRFRRILPLALLVIFLCVLAIATLQSGYEFASGMKSAVYSMLFIKNFQPHPGIEEDYFQQLEKANDFFTHYWSLCVEIQFYLLAPVVLHACKPPTDKPFSSFAFMTAISAGSFAYSLLSSPTDAFDSTPARLWQFLAGAMAFHADLILSGWTSLSETAKDTKTIGESRKRALAFPAIFAVIATVSVLWTGDWEVTLRFYTTFFTALTLALRCSSALLCHGYLQLIGDVSYSLYLIHWPVVCVLDILDIDEPEWKLAAMVTAFLLALACHYSYEKRYLTLSTKSTVILVLALYVATAAAIGAASRAHHELEQQASIVTLPPVKVKQFEVLTQAEIDKRNTQLNKNDLRYKDCKVKAGNNPMGFCDLTNGNGTLHFLIMGNSYSANIGGLIQNNFRQHYGKLQVRSIPQCEPLVNTPKDQFCPKYKSAHQTFDADVEKEHPDVLFLIARFIHPNEPIKRPIETDPLYMFMEKRLKYFEDHVTKKVFLMQAFPTPVHGPEDFEKRMKKAGIPITPYMPQSIDADAIPMKERVRKLAEKCTKCVIFDIDGPFLNEAGNFTVYSPQKLRYFDRARHLNILGRQLIDPVFAALSSNFSSLLESRYPDNIVDSTLLG